MELERIEKNAGNEIAVCLIKVTVDIILHTNVGAINDVAFIALKLFSNFQTNIVYNFQNLHGRGHLKEKCQFKWLNTV